MDGYQDVKEKWRTIMKESSMGPSAVAYNDICYLIDLLEACEKRVLIVEKVVKDMVENAEKIMACAEKMEVLLL